MKTPLAIAVSAIVEGAVVAFVFGYIVNYRLKSMRVWGYYRKVAALPFDHSNKALPGLLREVLRSKAEYLILVRGPDLSGKSDLLESLRQALLERDWFAVKVDIQVYVRTGSIKEAVLAAVVEHTPGYVEGASLDALWRSLLRRGRILRWRRRVAVIYDPPSMVTDERGTAHALAIEGLAKDCRKIRAACIVALPDTAIVPHIRSIPVNLPERSVSETVQRARARMSQELRTDRFKDGEVPYDTLTNVLTFRRLRLLAQEVHKESLAQVSLDEADKASGEVLEYIATSLLRSASYQVSIEKGIVNQGQEAPVVSMAMVYQVLSVAEKLHIVRRVDDGKGSRYSFANSTTFRAALAEVIRRSVCEDNLGAQVRLVLNTDLGLEAAANFICDLLLRSDDHLVVKHTLKLIESTAGSGALTRVVCQLAAKDVEPVVVESIVPKSFEPEAHWRRLKLDERSALVRWRVSSGNQLSQAALLSLADSEYQIRWAAAMAIASSPYHYSSLNREIRKWQMEFSRSGVLQPELGTLIWAAPLSSQFLSPSVADSALQELISFVRELIEQQVPGALGLESSLAQGLKLLAGEGESERAIRFSEELAKDGAFWFTRFNAIQALTICAAQHAEVRDVECWVKGDQHPLVNRAIKLGKRVLSNHSVWREVVWVDESETIALFDSELSSDAKLLLGEVIVFLNMAEYAEQRVRDSNATRNHLPPCMNGKAKASRFLDGLDCATECEFGMCSAFAEARAPEGIAKRGRMGSTFLYQCEEAARDVARIRHWDDSERPIGYDVWRRMRLDDDRARL